MYGLQTGRTGAEKERFYDDLRNEWDLHSVGELVLGMGGFNGHVGEQIEGYECVHEGNGIGERNVEGKMLEFCDEKELCVANTWEERSRGHMMVEGGREGSASKKEGCA